MREHAQLGVDPGRHSGWALISSDGKLVAYGLLLLGSKYDYKNILKIKDLIEGLTAEYEIDKLYIEDQFSGKWRGSGMRVSEIKGWWRAIAACYGIDSQKYTVQHWRKIAFEEYPKDDPKEKAIQRVKELFKVDTSPDTSEAVLIAYSAYLEFSGGV